MNEDQSPVVAAVGTGLTLLFAWVGLAMWHDAPSPADAAVGKALVTFAGAAAFVTIVLIISLWERENPTTAGTRRSGPRHGDA